jgi:hypothetical protein
VQGESLKQYSRVVLINTSPLVSFGALLLVANLSFQSFVQQTASFPERLVANGTAQTTTIHNLTDDALQGGSSLASCESSPQ